jgi:transketolase
LFCAQTSSGISNAVGLAAAEAHLAATFNKPGFNLVDNYTYCIVGDGCLQEGVSSEASSLAGHLKLGKLIVLYDDNNITIDGETELSFTEEVLKRYESYGWHVSSVSNGNDDLDSLNKAISEAKKVADKPSLIAVKTIIGFGASVQGTEKVHGAPLGADEVAAVKRKFGFDPETSFFVPDAVKQFYASIAAKGAESEAQWKKVLDTYCTKFPDLGADLKRRIKGELPAQWADSLPRYTPNDPAAATRKLSENVLNAIADKIPELVGGSADLTGSNYTRWKSAQDFQANSNIGNYAGRYFRFGVREHGMAAMCNGMAAYGGLIPFGATFLNFITYAWGAVRLSALSHFGVIYIMTHDSIGLGEDGPTHQPIETLALCRATPNMLVLRPADGNEVAGAYKVAIERRHTPSVLSLSRQNVPHLEGSSIEGVEKGAYVLCEAENPQAILVGTGTEVSLCVEAAKELAKQKIKARVVSMPCMEIFEEQTQAYKESIFLKGVPVLSVEVLSSMPWYKYAHCIIGIDKFGASAPAKVTCVIFLTWLTDSLKDHLQGVRIHRSGHRRQS